MTSLAEINVVPLVDVMLVLLIIFMVAAPMIQRGIDVKLPQSRRATSVTGERVEITLPDSIRQSRTVFVGKQEVKLENLQEIVRQRMETGADQGSVPARRRQRAVSGSDGRDRRAEGGRGAEHRHGRQDAERALMDVTDVLRGRMQTPGGAAEDDLASRWPRTSSLAAALIVSRGGLPRSRHDAPATLMTISLARQRRPGKRRHDRARRPSGAGGDAAGRRAKREAVRAPAAKTPEMTMPLPNAKTVKPTTSPNVKQAPDEARGRTPTKGKETAFGSAIADTGVRGQGFGLSTGGGAGSGSSLEITGDFCCPEYLATMITRIRAAWNQNQGAQRQPA